MTGREVPAATSAEIEAAVEAFGAAGAPGGRRRLLTAFIFMVPTGTSCRSSARP